MNPETQTETPVTEQERLNAYVRHYEDRAKRHWTELPENFSYEEIL